MRYLILLVLFSSCVREEIIVCQKTCFSMQISDAIPIQFWVNGQQSFNEAQECGMTQVCFCQPFNCDDPITIQLTDDDVVPVELIENGNFVDGSGWSQTVTASRDWSFTAGKASVLLDQGIASEYLYQSQSGSQGRHRITCDIEIGNTGNSFQDLQVTLTIFFYSGGQGGTIINSYQIGRVFQVNINPDGYTFSPDIYLWVDGDFDTISIRASASAGGSSGGDEAFTIDNFSVKTANDIIYLVDIINQDETVLDTVDLSNVGENVFQGTIVPSELGICEKIYLKIFKGSNIIGNNNFASTNGTSSYPEWTNQGSGGIDWQSDNGAEVSLTSVDYSSYYAYEFDTPLETGQIIQFRFNGSVLSPTTAQLKFFWDYLGSPDQIPIDPANAEVGWSIDERFTTTGEPLDGIQFFDDNLNAQATDWIVNEFSVYVLEEVAQSDCIDLRSNHECTKLMSYTNSCDFGNSNNFISYETSPQPTFYLRVPMRIIDEENPQEQEDIELSDGRIISLRQSIQFKDLFEIGYLPNYMHRKIQLALMHETVTIEGQQYIRRDSYESSRIDNYPLKKATVLLTKYNSVIKNTI